MPTIDDFGSFETAWCPGCGNFQLLEAVKQALAASNIAPHEVLFVSGIGQAAKAPQYLNCNYFNGLHGRGLPVATGAKLANPALRVIHESGDGCTYGEGGNHFLAAARLGLRARFTWLDGADLTAEKLVLDELLPLAREGLRVKEIAAEDADRYLGVIEERVRAGRTGAQWLLDSLAAMRGQGLAAERLAALTAATGGGANTLALTAPDATSRRNAKARAT